MLVFLTLIQLWRLSNAPENEKNRRSVILFGSCSLVFIVSVKVKTSAFR